MKLSLALAPLSLVLLASAAHASSRAYRYSQDVSALALATPGLTDRTLYLDLQLSDGSQLGNGSTKVTLLNFTINGGSFGTALQDIGDVRRPVAGITELRDTASSIGGLADYALAFTVNTGAVLPRLQFDFTVDAVTFDDPTDYFSASLLLSDLSPISTTGNVGSESLGYRVVNVGTPEAFVPTTTFGVERATAGDPRFATLARPVVTMLAVPEPATFAALGLGLAAMMRRRKRA